jgi:hypothetical protein
MLFRRLEFAAILPQFRRNKIEIERAIQFRFVANLWDVYNRFFLACARCDRHGRETIFVKRPTAFQSAIAHLDVMLLASGKIIERERIFRSTHCT